MGCHYFGRREGGHNLRKHEGYHYIRRREGYHVFGKVRGITSLGDVGVSRLWESVWYHCLGRRKGYHSLGKVKGFEKVRGITALGNMRLYCMRTNHLPEIFQETGKLPQCGIMPSNFSFLQTYRKNCPSVKE